MLDIYPDNDRRKFRRVRINLTIIYRVDEPLSARLVVGGKEIEAAMVDLSEGGMSILTNYNLPASTNILIRFTLFKVDKRDVSFYGPVEIKGEVRYCSALSKNEYRLGICFTKIEEKDKLEIRNFVETTINLLKPEDKQE
jgi:c-di-GMP-binding flagellar brake protein YcgR